MTVMIIIMNIHNNNIVKTRFHSTTPGSFVGDSIPFYSILFHSIPFYSILFHSIPFYSILFHSIPFYSISTASFFRNERWNCSWTNNPINYLVFIYFFNCINTCNFLMQLKMVDCIRKTHQIFSIYLDDITIHS
jgi:hypothetical protein